MKGHYLQLENKKGRKELMKEAVINSLKADLFLYLRVLSLILISMKLKHK